MARTSEQIVRKCYLDWVPLPGQAHFPGPRKTNTNIKANEVVFSATRTGIQESAFKREFLNFAAEIANVDFNQNPNDVEGYQFLSNYFKALDSDPGFEFLSEWLMYLYDKSSDIQACEIAAAVDDGGFISIVLRVTCNNAAALNTAVDAESYDMAASVIAQLIKLSVNPEAPGGPMLIKIKKTNNNTQDECDPAQLFILGVDAVLPCPLSWEYDPGASAKATCKQILSPDNLLDVKAICLPGSTTWCHEKNQQLALEHLAVRYGERCSVLIPHLSDESTSKSSIKQLRKIGRTLMRQCIAFSTIFLAIMILPGLLVATTEFSEFAKSSGATKFFDIANFGLNDNESAALSLLFLIQTILIALAVNAFGNLMEPRPVAGLDNKAPIRLVRGSRKIRNAFPKFLASYWFKPKRKRSSSLNEEFRSNYRLLYSNMIVFLLIWSLFFFSTYFSDKFSDGIVSSEHNRIFTTSIKQFLWAAPAIAIGIISYSATSMKLVIDNALDNQNSLNIVNSLNSLTKLAKSYTEHVKSLFPEDKKSVSEFSMKGKYIVSKLPTFAVTESTLSEIKQKIENDVTSAREGFARSAAIVATVVLLLGNLGPIKNFKPDPVETNKDIVSAFKNGISGKSSNTNGDSLQQIVASLSTSPVNNRTIIGSNDNGGASDTDNLVNTSLVPKRRDPKLSKEALAAREIGGIFLQEMRSFKEGLKDVETSVKKLKESPISVDVNVAFSHSENLTDGITIPVKLGIPKIPDQDKLVLDAQKAIDEKFNDNAAKPQIPTELKQPENLAKFKKDVEDKFNSAPSNNDETDTYKPFIPVVLSPPAPDKKLFETKVWKNFLSTKKAEVGVRLIPPSDEDGVDQLSGQISNAITIVLKHHIESHKNMSPKQYQDLHNEISKKVIIAVEKAIDNKIGQSSSQIGAYPRFCDHKKPKMRFYFEEGRSSSPICILARTDKEVGDSDWPNECAAYKPHAVKTNEIYQPVALDNLKTELDTFMKDNPTYLGNDSLNQLLAVGYADSTGLVTANLRVARRRANNIKKLINEHTNYAFKRFAAIGRGEEVATSIFAQGELLESAFSRRVDLRLCEPVVLPKNRRVEN